MDKDARRLIRAAALFATGDQRKRMLDRWMDNGLGALSDGQEKELEAEVMVLEKITERATILAKVVLDEVDEYLETDVMVSSAKKRGLSIVKDEDEDEEDEEFSK